jgi:acylphosphatase
MKMLSRTRTVRVRIEGQVQGVGYRDWLERTADELGLYGSVRNRRDGSVEAVFYGDPELVDEMLERCRAGPTSATVTGVRVDEEDGAYCGFVVLPTE